MKTDLYDIEAKKAGTIEVPDRLFARVWNPDLVHQALRVQTANRRRVLAHTKDRSEVRGGGIKPWRQKGTGRARHGSIRSPLWVGGGVTFGPTKERKFTLRINKKMRQGAIFSALSEKLKDGEVKIVNSISLTEPKTKALAEILKRFGESDSTLIIVKTGNRNVHQAARNIPKVKVLNGKSLNVYDILRHKYILIEEGAIQEISEHYHAIE